LANGWRDNGLNVVLLIALRSDERASAKATLMALGAEAPTILRPPLLSENAVGALMRATLGNRSSDGLSKAEWTASGGNPLYVAELLRALELDDRHLAEIDPAELLVGGLERVGALKWAISMCSASATASMSLSI
jgi:hypothetical protein